MAGGAAKKAAVRQRGASLVWIGVAIAVNVAYVAVRFARRALPSRGETALLLLLEGIYMLSVMSILQSAKLGASAELAIDLFVLAAVVQLLSLVWPSAWYMLLLIPAYGLWSFRGPLMALVRQDRTAELDLMKKDAAAAAGSAPAEDDVMAAKRQRRLQHKEKLRERFALRR